MLAALADENTRPLQVELLGGAPGLTALDDPAQLGQPLRQIDRFPLRFDRQKPHSVSAAYLQQVTDAIYLPMIFVMVLGLFVH